MRDSISRAAFSPSDRGGAVACSTASPTEAVVAAMDRTGRGGRAVAGHTGLVDDPTRPAKRGAQQQFVIRKVRRCAGISRQWRQRVQRATAGGDHDQNIVVCECPQCGDDQLFVVGVRDGALGDVDDGSASVEVAPPLR
jgi:hypothetical protein